MARKRIQYPSVSRVIRIPVPYPTVPGGDFNDWEFVLKPKPVQQGSFNNLVVIPTPYPVVPGGDFPKFDLVQKPKPTQLGSFTNTVYLPAAAVAFQPYIFTQFSEPQRTKQVQDFDFDDFYTTTPVVTSVFSQFSQPQSVKPVQQDFLDTPQFQITPVVQTYLFSEFSQPKVTVKVFQENTFNDYEAVANFFQPVFSVFEQPRFKQVRQDPEVQFTIFPFTQVVTQPYVFGTFSQPFTKKQVNDQPTWFISTAVSQPYVFSAFSQPQPIRFQKEQYVQTSYYPVVVVPPPVFTGFNDFGLAQQLVGTQRKQDGGYVQFTVLPMPLVVSPYFFTGFSNFQELLPNTAHSQRGLIGLGSSFNNVIIPIVPPDDVLVGGRWLKDPFRHHAKATTYSGAIQKAAAVLSKMGGHARAQALTANQRSNIASKAAQTRWNPPVKRK